MSKKKYMEGRNQALEQIIQDQQNQLEKVLADNTVLSDALRLAITTFKVELSKAIQTIEYDGGFSYTFDTSINNCIDNWNDEEEE